MPTTAQKGSCKQNSLGVKRVDAKGRINLGVEVAGKAFNMTRNNDGRIILTPKAPTPQGDA